MRKIYSLVLMAAALLVGTNAWADVHQAQASGDVAKVKIGSGEWQFASSLNDAFDYVQSGQTAQIELLDNVNLTAPITMPATISSSVLAGTCQNITLNLNNKEITADQNVTVFRLIKGTLNIEGKGSIKKTSIGSNVSEGKAVITVFGAEDKEAANWSNLTIGKDVTVSITPDANTGTGIIITEMSALPSNSSDPLYAASTTDARRTKYGYCTYYDASSIWNTQSPKYTQEQATAAMNARMGSEDYPLACGALYNNDTKGFQQGAAFGVKVTIAGTVIAGNRALQINGIVNQKPACTEGRSKRDMATYPNAPYYQYQYPYINITSTAHINSSENGGCCGIYASGYGVFDIAGEVYGATGVYLKASDVRLIDAVIYSTCDTYEPSNGGASGVGNAGGSAIAIESNDAYAGGSGINITGDTRVTGGGGYAIADETYKNDGSSTTSAVTIEGGTIEAGNAGAIIITDGTAPNTTVVGGTFDADQITVTHGDEPATTTAVNTYTPENTHTTVVTDGDKTIIVISEGTPPSTANSVIGATANTSIKWQNSSTTSETLTSDKSLKELEINEDYVQTLILGDVTTDPSNPVYVTFTVDRIIMGQNAQIIVNPGSKLIVKGDQGIVAPSTSNIILKTNETTPAEFLFKPSVSSNRHPNATVQLIANSYTQSSINYLNQRFGVPTYSAVKAVTAKNPSTSEDVQVGFTKYENNGWTVIGYVNVPGYSLNLSKLNDPFGYYSLQCNTPNVGTIVSFSGELVGNVDATLTTGQNTNGWSTYTNSYTAKMSTAAMMSMFDMPGITNAAVYVQKNMTADDNYFDWETYDRTTAIVRHLADVKLNPMQAFLIKDPGAEVTTSLALNYETMVWNPGTSAAPAPARVATQDMTMAAIKVYNSENVQKDAVYMIESDQFSADIEKGYDSEKYMGSQVKLYIMNDAKYATCATDDLNNTYLGFSCAETGMYTLSFEHIAGKAYALVDLKNNIVINMVEGATYQFNADENENDYRFKIINRQELPTDLESVNTTNNVKANGIYTITGQYLGNMSVWNTLPAGIYVVDGVKKIK